MAARLVPLLAPSRHSPLLGRRRALAIVTRVRAFASLFAFLTVAWIPIDLAFLGPPWSERLMPARLAAACAFALLAIACSRCNSSPLRARIGLTLLFCIPTAFFVAAQFALRGSYFEGLAAGFAAAYAFPPFLLACGIAVFPLTVAEAAALVGLAFAAEAWFLDIHAELPAYLALNAFWLLFLIAAVSAFAALSQTRLLVAALEQAVRDPLTGCLRRESGRELLEIQLALAERRGAPLAVLFCDIDHFKEVNDTFGHEAGDAVLAAAAESLRACVRESDSVLRWGGEEFVLVLHDANRDEAVRCIGRFRERGAGRAPDGRPVTLSIGVAEYREDGTLDARALVDLADRRMYAAKTAGRNRYVCHDVADATPILTS